MWYEVSVFLHDVHRKMFHMSQTEWLVVFVALLFVGAYCMRGYGSRTGY